MSSNLIRHEQCPQCAEKGRDNGKDNLGIYDDNHGHCFSCNYHINNYDGSDASTPSVLGISRNNAGPVLSPVQGSWEVIGKYQNILSRKILEETCKHFSYTVGEYNGKPCMVAPFFKDNKQVAQKLRFQDKKFAIIGDGRKNLGLWGKQLWTTGRKIVITEGELDCLSVAQVQSCKWPTVSLPNGAAGAKTTLERELEWLETNFDEIVLFFDNDEPGQTAAKECAVMFSPGRCKIATMSQYKDANEALMAGAGPEIINAIWRAVTYRPDGIINAEDTWDLVKTPYHHDALYPWEGLNTIAHGARVGEIVTLCAGTGIGKSQLCREISYQWMNEGKKVGYIALEESIKRTAYGFMSLHANRLLHLEESIPEEELNEYWKATCGSGNLYLYDHWGSADGSALNNKIRYLARGCGVQWFVLDHVSILVSGVGDGDERRMIDNLMTNLRSLVEELNVGMLLVSHLKRPEGKTHEEGGRTTLGQLRGSAAIGQLSDIVIGVERDQQDKEGKDVSTVRVLKNRFSGDTGVACTLRYSHDTGRLTEEVMAFELGGE